MDAVKRYTWNVLVSLDQLVNTVFGGDPDETMSSRIAKYQHIGFCRWLGRLLEAIDPGHLKDSLEQDEGSEAVLK